MKIFRFEHEIFIWESNKTKHHNLLEKIFFFFSKYMKQLNTCFFMEHTFYRYFKGFKIVACAVYDMNQSECEFEASARKPNIYMSV